MFTPKRKKLLSNQETRASKEYLNTALTEDVPFSFDSMFNKRCHMQEYAKTAGALIKNKYAGQYVATNNNFM